MNSALFGSSGSRRGFLIALISLIISITYHNIAHSEGDSPKPWLGIEMQPAEEGGILVRHVFQKSPAEKVGMLAGDRVIKADGVDLDRPQQLVDIVGRSKVGDRLELVLRRGKRVLPKQVSLEPHPGMDYLFRAVHIGKRAPELRALDPVRGEVPKRLKQLRGKVVVLDFWASWCSACKSLAPKLRKWQTTYGERGLAILALSSDKTEQAKRTAHAWKMNYLVATDIDQNTATAYRVHSVPSLYFIDRKGVIRHVMIGQSEADSVEAEKLLKELLAQP